MRLWCFQRTLEGAYYHSKQSAERAARGALRTPEGAYVSVCMKATDIYIYIYLTVDFVGHTAGVVFAPSGVRKAPRAARSALCFEW